ncbi:MAG: DUF2624 family protein [Bacillales bacterium]|nr:DUF2624 family protein [Bacillales bacterium]
MFKELINNYIDKMTIESAIKASSKLNIYFTYEEGKIIVPFLKNNKDLIDRNKKHIFIKKLSNIVNESTLKKVSLLFDEIFFLRK